MYLRRFHRARVNAPVETCWAVFTEHENFGDWTNINWKITKPGDSEPNGLGCIRTGDLEGEVSATFSEIVNIWQPHRIYGYHVTDGIPLDRHQGVIRFWPLEPGRTEWVYDLRFKPTAELLEQAPDFVKQTEDGFKLFMADAEAECERRAFDIKVQAYPLPVEKPLKLT